MRAGGGWKDMEVKTEVFKPGITLNSQRALGELIKYMLIILGFCLGFTVAALLFIVLWIKLRGWSARRYDEARMVAERGLIVMRDSLADSPRRESRAHFAKTHPAAQPPASAEMGSAALSPHHPSRV